MQQQWILARTDSQLTPESSLKKEIIKLLEETKESDYLLVLAGNMNCSGNNSFIKNLVTKHGPLIQ